MGGQHPLFQKVAICRARVQGRGSHSLWNALETLSPMSQFRYYFISVNLRLVNKLTIEVGNFFTDAMRDSNSHEFEEMVDPITCTPEEESAESLGEIDETLTEKESSVTTAFSWSNMLSHNCCGATKRPKMDDTVVVESCYKFQLCLFWNFPLNLKGKPFHTRFHVKGVAPPSSVQSFPFCFSLVLKTQLNHWTKRMVSTWLTT